MGAATRAVNGSAKILWHYKNHRRLKWGKSAVFRQIVTANGGYGVKDGLRRDTKAIARALVARFGSFANVIAAPLHELEEIENVGRAGIAAIKTVQAATLRFGRAEVMHQPVLNNWDRLMDYLNAALARERVEHFRILFLDNRNRLLADEAQARGTVNHTPVYPREVVKRALELSASAVILVHNHPSGDPTPSTQDVKMTLDIIAVAAPLGVAVHDHIIVGRQGHVSLKGLKLI